MRPATHRRHAGALLIVQGALLWVASLQMAWAMPEFSRLTVRAVPPATPPSPA